MKKRIEKQIENDLISAMPNDHLSFEAVSGKVDWNQYKKERKPRRSIWKKILIPLGAAVSLVFAVGLTGAIIILNTGYGSPDPNHFVEGSYSLVSFQSYLSSDFSFSVGDKASINHESSGGPGAFLLSQDKSGFDGCLAFEEGPLSTATFTDVSYPSVVSINASFSSEGLDFAISIHFFSATDPFFTVRLSSTSSNDLAELTYR